MAVCWDCQRLRCSACGLPHTARAPDEAQGDKHSETAAAMMVLLRYDAGVPLNRLEQLQHALKTPVPSSTQWDVANTRVSAVEPVYRELIRSAAQSSIVHNDDTYVRVLEFMGKRRAKLLERGALPSPERTGLFTTAIVAFDEAGRTIALFFTGRQHAGENLTDLLNHRAQELEPPVLMCDALARNLPKGHQVVESNCASHGRRHFVDEAENFPSECRYLLEMLGRVFKVDELCLVGWMLAHRESAALAQRLIAESCRKQDIEPDQLTLHADRGSSMRSKPVGLLLADLGVTKTHSRPYVSNDNPYSESQFKTMKYCPQFPSRFGSAEDGRLFCCGFFAYYNFHHRHSGIGLMTPADVHYGRAEQLTTARRQILLEAQQAHPERFVRGTPQPPVLPPQAWINPPLEKTTLHDAAQAPLAAASIPGVPPFSASRNEILIDVDVDRADLTSLPTIIEAH